MEKKRKGFMSTFSLAYTSGVASGSASSSRKSRCGYERFVNREDPECNPPKVIKLRGGKSHRFRCPSVSKFMSRAPVLVAKKLKGACGKVFDAASSSNAYFSDLFSSNKLLIHLTAAPVSMHRKNQLYPTVGFISPLLDRTEPSQCR